MCQALMEIKEEGVREGILDKTQKVIINMLNKGFDEAEICQIYICQTCN